MGGQRFSAAEKMLAGDRPGDGESTTDPCDPPPDSWSAGFDLDLDLGVGVGWLDGAVVYRSHACMVGVGSHVAGHSCGGAGRGGGRTATAHLDPLHEGRFTTQVIIKQEIFS